MGRRKCIFCYVKIGFLQFCPAFGKRGKNLELARELLSQREFDLMVLPELATTGYLFRDRREARVLAEEVPGPSTEFFLELARRKDALIAFGIAELCGDALYNSAVACLPNGKWYVYRKTHLFFREKKIFDPGDTGFFVFPFRDLLVGMMVCFDWIFPESVRVLALKGADIVLHLANLVLPWGQTGMTLRSIENSVFTITANRTGRESRAGACLSFTGRSQVVSHRGEVLTRAGDQEQAVRVVEADPTLSRDKWLNPLNHLLKDRKQEHYGALIS